MKASVTANLVWLEISVTVAITTSTISAQLVAKNVGAVWLEVFGIKLLVIRTLEFVSVKSMSRGNNATRTFILFSNLAWSLWLKSGGCVMIEN